MTPSFNLEKLYGGVSVGVDEAGCGPWAGPVIAAAVVLDTALEISLLTEINDSKKLTPGKREYIMEKFLKLSQKQIWFSIGEATVLEIDQMNIREASKLAMKRAIDGLKIHYDQILIDGNRKPIFNKPSHLIIHGDQQSYSIAAASIIAKVTRDRIMKMLADKTPEYLWHKNAGYGTVAHHQAIQKIGITSYHRQSFAPIRDYIRQHNIDIAANNETLYTNAFLIK